MNYLKTSQKEENKKIKLYSIKIKKEKDISNLSNKKNLSMQVELKVEYIFNKYRSYYFDFIINFLISFKFLLYLVIYVSHLILLFNQFSKIINTKSFLFLYLNWCINWFICNEIVKHLVSCGRLKYWDPMSRTFKSNKC